jgi:ubiquinone/menaquinone biosynthesis C-methylase UbiE
MSIVLVYNAVMEHIKTQYNNFSQTYSENIDYDDPSNDYFYKEIDFNLSNKKILDIGCGNGADSVRFQEMGALTYGVDPSYEFINEAKTNNPLGIFKEGSGEQVPFEDSTFDVIVSKWAMQTSPDVKKFISEASRVLKPGGMFVYLSKHPMQQYFGKIRQYGENVDYYKQEISTLYIYEGKITLHEPTHTFNDYLNDEFFKNFELLSFIEQSDFPASERFNNGIYPTFFVVKARKK